MPFNTKSPSKTICRVTDLHLIFLTTLLIAILGISSSFASQTFNSDVNEMSKGSKFHYKINTPTFWDLNQTHNVTLSFEIDSFGQDVEIIGGQIGLHVKDDNNFTHYYGLHSFGPFIDIQSTEEFNLAKNFVMYPFLLDALIRYVPNEITFQFVINLYVFDLVKNVNPKMLIFYLAFNFHETTIDQYSTVKQLNDPSVEKESVWVKVAEYRIDLPKNNGLNPMWLGGVMIVLLIKYAITKNK